MDITEIKVLNILVIEKAQVPAFVFTRGLLLVERRCLDFLAGVSIEFRYAGWVDESA